MGEVWSEFQFEMNKQFLIIIGGNILEESYFNKDSFEISFDFIRKK